MYIYKYCHAYIREGMSLVGDGVKCTRPCQQNSRYSQCYCTLQRCKLGHVYFHPLSIYNRGSLKPIGIICSSIASFVCPVLTQ